MLRDRLAWVAWRFAARGVQATARLLNNRAPLGVLADEVYPNMLAVSREAAEPAHAPLPDGTPSLHVVDGSGH